MLFLQYHSRIIVNPGLSILFGSLTDPHNLFQGSFNLPVLLPAEFFKRGSYKTVANSQYLQ